MAASDATKDDELQQRCRAHKLPTSGNNSVLGLWKKDELIEKCKENKLPTSGTKDQLIARLTYHHLARPKEPMQGALTSVKLHEPGTEKETEKLKRFATMLTPIFLLVGWTFRVSSLNARKAQHHSHL